MAMKSKSVALSALCVDKKHDMVSKTSSYNIGILGNQRHIFVTYFYYLFAVVHSRRSLCCGETQPLTQEIVPQFHHIFDSSLSRYLHYASDHNPNKLNIIFNENV